MTTLSPKIVQVVVGLPVEGPFDYVIHPDLANKIKIGQRVRVMFNSRKRVAYVVKFLQKSKLKELNNILEILDYGVSITSTQMMLAEKFSHLYGCTLGDAIETILPPVLRKSRIVECPPISKRKKKEPGACEVVHDHGAEKRWEHISERIKKCLSKDEQVIFLVPAVAYALDVIKRLEKQFKGKVFSGKDVKGVKKEKEFWQAQRSGEIKIFVGTRSAVFSPLPNLGLIVVYDEENTSYKEEQSPHYHVRDVAQMRADIEGCNVSFISSAPSAEVWYKVKKKKWPLVTLTCDDLAWVQAVDMTNYNPRKTSIISFPLQNEIKRTLELNGKVLLLINQQDFSSWIHPQDGKEIRAKAEKIEGELRRFYPDASRALYQSGDKNFSLKVKIILASSAIYQYKDKFRPDLIGMINADTKMNYVDFRSAHRTFVGLIQLRQWAKDKLVLQTKMRDQYAIKAFVKNDFVKFYREEFKLRKELGFPPFKELAAISVRGLSENIVREQADLMYEQFMEIKPRQLEVSHPYPEMSLKLRGRSRYTIMLKSSTHRGLLNIINKVVPNARKRSGNIVTVDIHP